MPKLVFDLPLTGRGTTERGGVASQGTVYRLDPATGTTTTVYSFTGGPTGGNPSAALMQASDGFLYGTTQHGLPQFPGGMSSFGTVYRLDPVTDTVTTILTFPTGLSGHTTYAGLTQASDGFLYGTNREGSAQDDAGAIFRLDLATGAVTTIHSFRAAAPSARNPYFALMQATDGFLYGATPSGGALDGGAIYRLDPVTSEVTTVHSFTPPGGRHPLSELTQASDGFLYGATVAGGAADAGTIYRLDPVSGMVSTIYSFDSSSGRNPRGALTQATDGHLYGATSAGGPYGGGTLFRILLNRAPVAVPQDVHASSELTSVLEASYAGDGDPFTRWSSEFSDSQFIQVDLGENTPFDRIVLRWETARAAEYEIHVSSDGEDWSTLRRVAASGDVDDLSGFEGSARYVRMQGLRRATHWGYSLFEFEVYRDGINIAAGRPMTASSAEHTVFAAAFAVDGDPSTRWMSEFADEQWLAVDLGSTVALDRVVLKWDASYAADYELLVSNDASSWRTVRTVTDGDGGVDELTGLTAGVRYVGLLLHRRATPWGFSLWEFEVFGSPTGIAP